MTKTSGETNLQKMLLVLLLAWVVGIPAAVIGAASAFAWQRKRRLASHEAVACARVYSFLRPASRVPQRPRCRRSLVGARPLEVGEDALIEGWQRRRLAVKPGMTGLWQICGSSRIPMQEMVKLDYIYGANWSIWLDLKVLIRTVPYVSAASSSAMPTTASARPPS